MARPSQPPDLTALGFGDEIDEVLRGANPNPTRQGCPPHDVLVALSRRAKADWRPRLRAPARMFAVLREVRDMQRAQVVATQARSSLYWWWMAAAAAAAVVVAVGRLGSPCAAHGGDTDGHLLKGEGTTLVRNNRYPVTPCSRSSDGEDFASAPQTVHVEAQRTESRSVSTFVQPFLPHLRVRALGSANSPTAALSTRPGGPPAPSQSRAFMLSDVGRPASSTSVVSAPNSRRRP